MYKVKSGIIPNTIQNFVFLQKYLSRFYVLQLCNYHLVYIYIFLNFFQYLYSRTYLTLLLNCNEIPQNWWISFLRFMSYQKYRCMHHLNQLTYSGYNMNIGGDLPSHTVPTFHLKGGTNLVGCIQPFARKESDSFLPQVKQGAGGNGDRISICITLIRSLLICQIAAAAMFRISHWAWALSILTFTKYTQHSEKAPTNTFFSNWKCLLVSLWISCVQAGNRHRKLFSIS